MLEVIAAILEPLIRSSKRVKPLTFIQFIKSGEKESRSNQATGILITASDWEIRVDLKKRLQFPGEIVQTTLRPDIVIWSKATKQVIMIELTVPWEERIECANERKRTKYDELKTECERAGWKTWCTPIEVGCRGFLGKSIWTMSKLLGIKGNNRKQLSKQCEQTTERASNWIWLKRNETSWSPS